MPNRWQWVSSNSLVKSRVLAVLGCSLVFGPLSVALLGVGTARFELRCEAGAACTFTERYLFGAWSSRQVLVGLRELSVAPVGDEGASLLRFGASPDARSSSWSTSLDASELRTFARAGRAALQAGGPFEVEQRFHSLLLVPGVMIGALWLLMVAGLINLLLERVWSRGVELAEDTTAMRVRTRAGVPHRQTCRVDQVRQVVLTRDVRRWWSRPFTPQPSWPLCIALEFQEGRRATLENSFAERDLEVRRRAEQLASLLRRPLRDDAA